MGIAEDSKIVQRRTRLLAGMREYMKEDDVAYDESHVVMCERIVAECLDGVESTDSRESALKLVKKAVLALNQLNEQCEHELIETNQREDICAILIRAGALRGFNADSEDITEEWREW